MSDFQSKRISKGVDDYKLGKFIENVINNPYLINEMECGCLPGQLEILEISG